MPKTLLNISAPTDANHPIPSDGQALSEGRRTPIISISLPASKSISNRLLIMQALSENEISIDNLSTADDTVLLSNALTTQTGEIHLGNAGTALRFATAWAAITPGERILTGTKRLCDRPLKPLIDSLRQCGADITCLEHEGHAPIRIHGKQLNGINLAVDGTQSSQFLTAMLLVAPYFRGTTRFTLDPDQVSLPYIQMTLALMTRAGAEIQSDDRSITINPGPYLETSFTVESDWSAASYFYLFSLFMPSSSILLEGLTAKSVQGDKIVRSIFADFGIHTEFTNRGARLENRNFHPDTPAQPHTSSSPNHPNHPDGHIRPDGRPPLTSINCLTFPDLAQTLAAAACGLNIPLRLTGLQTLRIKETDRIAALAAELQKCGTQTQTGPDYLEIQPADSAVSFSAPASPVPPESSSRSEHQKKDPQNSTLHTFSDTPQIATYSDHRMAMAFAPLAVIFGEIIIEDPDVVSKSFPGFWKEIKKLGFTFIEYRE